MTELTFAETLSNAVDAKDQYSKVGTAMREYDSFEGRGQCPNIRVFKICDIRNYIMQVDPGYVPLSNIKSDTIVFFPIEYRNGNEPERYFIIKLQCNVDTGQSDTPQAPLIQRNWTNAVLYEHPYEEPRPWYSCVSCLWQPSDPISQQIASHIMTKFRIETEIRMIDAAQAGGSLDAEVINQAVESIQAKAAPAP